jgi:uncharacterized protein
MDRQDYGKVRYVIIGALEGRRLTVAYAERNGQIRIISARAAEPHERQAYHEQNH